MVRSKERRELLPWKRVTDALLAKCWDCGLELLKVKASERLQIAVVDGLHYLELDCPHCGAHNAYEMADESADDFVLNSIDAPLPDPDDD